MVTSERIQKFVFTSSLTEKSNSLVSDGRCTQNTSSHAHLSQSCQSSQRGRTLHAHTCMWFKGQLGPSLLRAFSKKTSPSSRLRHSLCVPSISSLFCSIPPPNLDPDSFDADWNQNTTKCDSAVGCTVWSSGRPHSMYTNPAGEGGALVLQNTGGPLAVSLSVEARPAVRGRTVRDTRVGTHGLGSHCSETSHSSSVGDTQHDTGSFLEGPFGAYGSGACGLGWHCRTQVGNGRRGTFGWMLCCKFVSNYGIMCLE